MPKEDYSPTRQLDGRRKADQIMRNQLERYRKAFHVGQIITSEMNKEILFEVIINQANEAMESERSTVFLL